MEENSLLGQSYIEGPHLNDNEWNLDNILGLGFENHIFNILSAEMRKYYDLGAKINRTPKVRDNGKDIIIESPISLENILGTNFYLKEQTTLKIYIECKSSNHNKIPYNSFAGNLSRIKEEAVGYYVLVTNTTIVPFSFYQFKEDAENLGIEFVLIDQYLLKKYLLKNNAMIGKAMIPDYFDKIYLEYQANSCIIESKNAYEIYFWIRNYSNSIQIISMQINTDRNWCLNSDNIECILEPNNSYCLKLIAIKEYFDGIDDLILNVRSSFFDTSIQVKGLNISYNFRPQLIGEKNKKIIETIKKGIIENTPNHIYFLMGEAGVGKTRIIDEVLSEVAGREINFCRVSVEKDKNILLQLQEILIQDGYLSNDATYNSLEDIFININTTYRKYVIVLDDLHNASVEILNNIRKLLGANCPSGLTLLFVGRDDFSAGSIDYFSFLEFCKENYSSNIIFVEALADSESIQLIKSIVRGIPAFALKKIHSLSNNIPLFIIQVIEYMLDLKLVYLLNRNTVGIENTDSFSNHLYIPKSMEEIYDQRIECLIEQNGGRYMLKFLYTASYIGIHFGDYFANSFFEGKEELFRNLLERRYIVPSSGGYSFIHESLYLYINNKLRSNKEAKKEVGNYLLNVPYIFDQMDTLKKGQIHFWANNKDIARTYFSSAISNINNITNYSSINIEQSYYIYLEDIYSICTTYEQKKKTVACKIYIALHYHTPYEAIAMCSWAQQKLKSSKKFQKDTKFGFYLKEQMAHSYLNAGQLKKSEIILLDLLSKTILNIENCDKKAVFDMYDKLSNIYIKYNLHDIARNYCQLSLGLATELNDSNLQALSYITTAKLYFYTDKAMSKEYLNKADLLLSKEKAYRIKCHNDVSLLIMKLIESSEKDEQYLKKLIGETERLLDICIENNFANSVIRLYMLTAVLHYLLNIRDDKYFVTKKYIEKGIDASIKFGISTYIWQFYSLEAIILVRQKQDISKQKSLFDTVFNMLKKQNLNYLGNCDITYGNIFALTNVMFFYRQNLSENLFYQKISQISLAQSVDSCDFNCNKYLCQYGCHTNLEAYQKEWSNLSVLKDKQSILFGKAFEKYVLQDSTGYYIIIS